MNTRELTRWNQEHPEDRFPAYAWPGGYPIVYIMRDGDALCPACAKGENGSEAELDDGTNGRSGQAADWAIVGCDIHWEGPPETCAHCGAQVDSAYGDPDEEG